MTKEKVSQRLSHPYLIRLPAAGKESLVKAQLFLPASYNIKRLHSTCGSKSEEFCFTAGMILLAVSDLPE